ncbi:MAG: hypothetical protein ACK4F8_08100 [Aquabacterium sp.]
MLACRARLKGDVAVAWLDDDEAAAPKQAVRKASGTVVALDAATHDIQKIKARLNGAPLDFLPRPVCPPHLWQLASPGLFHVQPASAG